MLARSLNGAKASMSMLNILISKVFWNVDRIIGASWAEFLNFGRAVPLFVANIMIQQ
jgi:hypothetical protein